MVGYTYHSELRAEDRIQETEDRTKNYRLPKLTWPEGEIRSRLPKLTHFFCRRER
jgi:hypothetical protein